MKFWIDVTSLPHVHFFRALVKRLEKSGNEVLVTSREFGIMNEILDTNGIEYKSVGTHGGKSLESKLVNSSERVIELAKILGKERPDVGISKHSIESARVCFGLGIPSVMVIDHETAAKQSRLTAPLTDTVITPKATNIDKLEKYGPKEVVTFDGVCEVAHFHDFVPNKAVLSDLGLKKEDEVVIARPEPLLASHNFHESVLFSAIKELKDKFPRLEVVFIPRGKSDSERFRKLDVIVPDHSIDTLSLYSLARLMIGAGSCMNREAAVGGCPTISICPDRLPGVDNLLIEKGMMHHSLKKGDIIKKASEYITSEKQREMNGSIVKGFEDPHEKIMDAVSRLLK